MIDLLPGEFVVAALPADGVPEEHGAEEDEGEGRAPVDGRVAEEEVLHDVVVPAAHAEADVEKGPLPWLAEARSSCLSGSGTRALFEVIMATLRWTKSRQKGDL